MAADGENIGNTLAILQMEGKMREQIRELQERRASVMMTEISDLHKERDLAVSRVKQLEKTVADLQSECATVKTKLLHENDLNFKIKSLERTLLEERLISNDFKKKLLNAEKKAVELKTKLRRKSVDHRSPLLQNRLDQLMKEERSQSLGDLRNIQKQHKLESASAASGSRPSTEANLTDEQKGVSPSPGLDRHALVTAGQSPLVSPSGSPSGSPTLVTRRYTLTTSTTCDSQIQTDFRNQTDSQTQTDPLLGEYGSEVSGNSLSAEVQQLQQLNEELRLKLHQICIEASSHEESNRKTAAKLQALDAERASLNESFSQFSHWVHEKLNSVEEEMDICKIIYTLHGSLSQETKVIEELRKKLVSREASIKNLKMKNKYLKIALKEHEESLAKSREEASNLREQMWRAANASLSPSTLADLNRHISSVQLQQRMLPSPLFKKRQLEQEAGMQQSSKKSNSH